MSTDQFTVVTLHRDIYTKARVEICSKFLNQRELFLSEINNKKQ